MSFLLLVLAKCCRSLMDVFGEACLFSNRVRDLSSTPPWLRGLLRLLSEAFLRASSVFFGLAFDLNHRRYVLTFGPPKRDN